MGVVVPGRPDLVGEDLGIVLEADSFAWHGSRSALAADARRYNWPAAHGYLVLRFARKDVAGDRAHVAQVWRRP